MGAVSDGRASPERCSYGYNFGDLWIGRAGLPRFARMNLDAVGALRCERNGERHQFFVLDRDRSVGHRGSVKSPESVHRGRGVRIQSLKFFQVTHAVHDVPPVV